MIFAIQKALTETPLLAIFIVFWAGALASASSCTLIRIPVVFGYVAGTSDSKKKSLLVTILFVCGLIVSYTLLGLLLGFIGNLAYKLLGFSKYIFATLGLLLIFSGLFISGLIKTGKFASHCQIDNRFKNLSYLGAFLFGIVFAFLEMPACPCCGSVLFVIASFVVLKGSLTYSFMIFLSFAIGQSFPILLIGSSTSLVKYLTPKMERFEEYIRLVAGNILIILGIYFLMVA